MKLILSLDYDKLLSILDGARKHISLTSHHSKSMRMIEFGSDAYLPA